VSWSDSVYVYSNRLNLGKIRRERISYGLLQPHDISVIWAGGEMPDVIQARGGTISMIGLPMYGQPAVFPAG